MRILVAGCAGFIGFHLTERLLAEGHEVVGVDNFISGSPANATALQQRPRFQFVEHDITRPLPVGGHLTPLPSREGLGEGQMVHPLPSSPSKGVALTGPLDRIYDLACPASPVDFGPHRLEILAVCSRGVWELLDVARARGARLLHASTSEVYGDPKEHPQRETYWGHANPIGARSCYDEGKRFAEALLMAFHRQHGVEVRIPRIFNTYGPNMRRDDGRMLPNFIDQALAGQPLTVHGDGQQTRSFCFVSDLVDGLIRLMESDVREPVNLGNPVEITILEAAQEVISLIGSKSRIQFVPRPEDDPSVRRPDITRAKTMLGWQPQIDRTTGFARTIEWFKANKP